MPLGALFRGYDTPLSDTQAADYQRWKAALPRDLQNTEDYDLQGAFLASMKANGRDHMGDQFKKPNHMTFSDESQYSSPQMQGGHWAGTGERNPVNPHEDRSVFWASPFNLTQHPMLEMQRYFNDAEPGNTVIFPPMNYILRGR